MTLTPKLALAASLVATALSFGSTTSASAKDYYTIKQMGTYGGSCLIVYSAIDNEPVTMIDKKKGPLAFAIGNDWGKCPKTVTFNGQEIKFNLFPSYKVEGLVLTVYFATGARVAMFRNYNGAYKFSWIKAPKKA